MEVLPSIDINNLADNIKSQDSELLGQLTRKIKDSINQALTEIQKKFQNVRPKKIEDKSKTFLSDMTIRKDKLLELIKAQLKIEKAKKIFQNINEDIERIEEVVFLIRFFQGDTTEEFIQLIAQKGTRTNTIFFHFNNRIQQLTKLFTDGIHIDAKGLFEYLVDSQDSHQSDSPQNWIKTKFNLEIKDESDINIDTIVKLDAYYLKKSLEGVKNIVQSFIDNILEEKLTEVIDNLSGNNKQSGNDDDDGNDSEKKANENTTTQDDNDDEETKNENNNPIEKKLDDELIKVSNLDQNEQLLGYILESKRNIDEIIQMQSEYEDEAIMSVKNCINDVIQGNSSTDATGGSQASNKEKKLIQELSIAYLDDLISTQSSTYSFLSNKKPLIKFIQDFGEVAKQEALKILTTEKFMIQSSYIPVYFEEKNVLFWLGKVDFAHEQFAKLLIDFCNMAQKEFAKVSLKKGCALHPLYYCYFSENERDFYLVYYHPNHPKLKIYLTSSPMQAVLHKHLARMDVSKLKKKGFEVVTLNFYDPTLNIEFRNLFLDPKLGGPIVDNIEEVPEKLRYFVFMTIFMIHNCPTNATQTEVNFNALDFICFFNYMADYNSVYINFYKKKEPVPESFESYFPFVDFRKIKSSFLLYNLQDPARGRGLLSIRNQIITKPDISQFATIQSEVNENNAIAYVENEIYKYLQKNDSKTSFNFDGPNYLSDYLRKNNTFDGFVRVLDKKHGQSFHDYFVSPKREKHPMANRGGFEDQTKYSNIFVFFPCIQDSDFLLLIALLRNQKKVIVFTYTSDKIHFLQEEQPQHDQDLKQFVNFLLESFKMEPSRFSIQYYKLKSNNETVAHYLKKHYFPYTYVIEEILKNIINEKQVPEEGLPKDEIQIDMENFIFPFKSFVNMNVAENNLEIFKAYNLIYQEMNKESWSLANQALFWKYSEIRYALEGSIERAYIDNIQNVLYSFSVLAFTGRKSYFVYLKEVQDEETKTNNDSNNNNKNNQQPQVTYQIELYSLDYNISADDREILALIHHICQVSTNPKVVFNGAFSVKTYNNMLIYNQLEITLTTLSHMISTTGISMQKAFHKISQSLITHYEELENLMDQIKISNQFDNFIQKNTSLDGTFQSKSLIQSTSSEQTNQNTKQSKNPLTTLMSNNVKTNYSFFDDVADELVFQEKLTNQIGDLLSQIKNIDNSQESVQELNQFINILNSEDQNPAAYSYHLQESIIRSIQSNTNNIITDSETYAKLFEDIHSYKRKYEETLGITFPESQILFIMPGASIAPEKIIIIQYIFTSRKCIYYYLGSSTKVPGISKELEAFLQNFDMFYSESIKEQKQMEQKFHLQPLALKFSEDLIVILKSYPSMAIKFLIHIYGKQTNIDEDSLTLDTNNFRNFLNEYSDELFSKQIEGSKIKLHYKFIASQFLSPKPLLTKKPALLTFLNGTATIEQLNVVNKCLKNFKLDFQRNHIPDLENAFFSFNIAVKGQPKHFLLHLSGKEKSNATLKIFTNNVGDSDSIIDKMIQTYILQDDEENEQQQQQQQKGASNQPEKLVLSNIIVYKVDIPNIIYTQYLEISSFLVAYAVCNDMKDSSEVCGLLSLSPMHYLNELKTVEERCVQLGLISQAEKQLQQQVQLGQQNTARK